MKDKNRTRILIISVVAGVLLLIAILKSSNGRFVTEITRPSYQEADTSRELLLSDEEGNQFTLEIPVAAQALSQEQLQGAFDETFEAVCATLPGKNPSLAEITEDLVFDSGPGDYGMKADYTLADYSIISPGGEVDNSKLSEPTELEIQVILTYEKYSQSYVVAVTVLPRTASEEEILIEKILEAVESQESDGNDTLVLPSEIDGKKLTYYEETGERSALLLTALVLAVTLYYYFRLVLPQKRSEKRKEDLRRDYAEIVSTLALLVGSGMSTRNALTRMASDYLEKKKKRRVKGADHPAYEELAALVRRLDTGVPEEQAYREYGKSCGLHGYIRISGLLAQSLRKGNAELTAELSEESVSAFEERKTMAIRAGERASTRLVFPMIMMLAIVFIIIIVPAFASMY